MSYVQLISPLVLHADPVIAKHAVTKRYTDNKKTSAVASWFTSGVLPAGRIPALTGDVVSTAGSGAAALSNTTVTEGSYPKVNIDSAGRVTSGSVLTAGDVPNVSWAKVTTGKPTTAAGYGIGNLVPLSGGAVSGAISSLATPSSSLHAVTKNYVDSNLTGIVSGTLAVGDIVRKPVAVAPSGFLRCNGGYVDKTAYADLFGAVGYSLLTKVNLDYTSYAAVGGGRPWEQQYDFNTTQTSDITGWTTTTPYPFPFAYCQAVVTKNRVYVIGGFQNGAVVGTVYTAPINSDGTLGSWIATTTLPIALWRHQAVVVRNRIYLFGGEAHTTTVLTCAINSDGTLGSWSNVTGLPTGSDYSQAIVTKNRVYVLGGLNSNNMQSAPVNLDGSLGTWTTSATLPGNIASSKAVVTKNMVYLIAGSINNIESTSVYAAPINSDGTIGAWTAGTSIPVTISNTHSIVSKNRVYLLGGRIAGVYSSAVYSAPINSDGTLGTWTAGTSLPSTVIYSQSIVTKNRIYLLGGLVNSTSTDVIHTAPISGGLNDYSKFYDGSINKFDGSNVSGTIAIGDKEPSSYTMPGAGKPWQQQYDINTTQSGDITGWTVSSPLPGNLYYSQAVVTKNRVYLLGGIVSGSYSTTVYTASIGVDGSIGGWTSATSLPRGGGYSQAIVTKNRVYVFGGYHSTEIFSAVINIDGALGTWTNDGTMMPADLFSSQAVVTKNRVYLLGGYLNGNNSTAVYTAPINSDGTLGTWSAGTSLPVTIADSQAVVTKNRVYLLGGVVNGSVSDAVYSAPINTDGTLGTWSAGPSLPIKLASSHAVVVRNKVYLFAGYNNSSSDAGTYASLINSDGTLSPWTTASSLPVTVYGSQPVVTKNRIYLLGGVVSNAYSSAVYSASIVGGLNDYSPYYDGTITPYTADEPSYTMPGNGQPWRQQHQISSTDTPLINTSWVTQSSVLPYSIYNHALAVTKSKIYAIGGVANSSYTNLILSADISNGTIGAWTKVGELPTNISALSSPTALVHRNRIYLAGNGFQSISSAPINTDGTIGSWEVESPNPPSDIGGPAYAFISKGKLVAIRHGSAGAAKVAYADLGSNGKISSWSASETISVGIPFGASISITKNRLNIMGGISTVNNNVTVDTTVSTNILPDGKLSSSWSTYTPVGASSFAYAETVVTSKKVYVLGGRNYANDYHSAVQIYNVNSDGSISYSGVEGTLPNSVYSYRVAVTSDKLYLIGGATTNGGGINSTYSIPFSGGLNDYSPYYDGTIQPIDPNTTFKLPDYTASEANDINYYIKY